MAVGGAAAEPALSGGAALPGFAAASAAHGPGMQQHPQASAAAASNVARARRESIAYPISM